MVNVNKHARDELKKHQESEELQRLRKCLRWVNIALAVSIAVFFVSLIALILVTGGVQ